MLASCGKENGIPYPQYDYNLPEIGEATIENAIMLLESYMAIKAQNIRIAEEKRTAEILYILQLPLESWVDRGRWNNDEPKLSNYINTGKYDREPLSKYKNDPRVAARIEEIKRDLLVLSTEWRESQERIKRAGEERARLREEEKERAAEERRLKKERKKNQIAAWVEKNGTDNQKKRLSVNLLPDEEIINAIREESFAALTDFPRYEKLTGDDVDCSCGDYDEKKVIFDANDSNTATAEQFELMEKIKTLIPAAEITLREHTAYCDRCNEDDDVDDDGEIKLYSLKVGVTVGEFYFTREYAV